MWNAVLYYLICFFFFNDTATTEIYTLSLHDALPICSRRTSRRRSAPSCRSCSKGSSARRCCRDRKSTRLNSSHSQISYAVFCLKKKTRPDSRAHSRQNPQRRGELSATLSIFSVWT